MSVPVQNFSIQGASLGLVAGLIMLYAGGEFLVTGSTKLAKRLQMSPLLIGLTIVAFGTSMPEFFVGLIANFQDHQDIMIGNVLGSNIANIGLILGLSALLHPLQIRLDTIRTELFLVLAATIALVFIILYGTFTRPLGLLFVGSLFLYTYVSYRKAHTENKRLNVVRITNGTSYWVICFLIIFGLVLLFYGSDLFINSAVAIARHFEISELIIGLTLAAVGTSLPELASSFAAIRQRQDALLVGNIVGSNLFNLLMVLGGCALAKSYQLSSDLLFRDLPAVFLFSFLLVPIIAARQCISRWHGIFLLFLYALYLLYLTV